MREGEELSDWLLFMGLDLRPAMSRSLLEALGSPRGVLQASQAELLAIGGVSAEMATKIRQGPDRKHLTGWMDYAERNGVFVVPYDSPFFPPLLNEIPDPPTALLARGDQAALTGDAVAMVGTRHPSPYGRIVADRMARELSRAGLTVVSGGAVGIDTASHQGACVDGRTVAVLGCGLDVPYPPGNQDLFDAVCRHGAVISEYPLGARPDTWRFPARNRIISGMSLATIVVEAARKSGALITAGYAGQQGREVMAVPGLVDSPRSRGCHALIRDGATLIENADQVLESLGRSTLLDLETNGRVDPVDVPLDQGLILLALKEGQKHLDDLINECRLPAAQTGAALTMLEMRGLVKRIPGNHYTRL